MKLYVKFEGTEIEAIRNIADKVFKEKIDNTPMTSTIENEVTKIFEEVAADGSNSIEINIRPDFTVKTFEVCSLFVNNIIAACKQFKGSFKLLNSLCGKETRTRNGEVIEGTERVRVERITSDGTHIRMDKHVPVSQVEIEAKKMNSQLEAAEALFM